MSEIHEQVENGQQTFLDLNGDPLAAGQVFFYVPGTTVPKTTWVDKDFVVANTNPILLDQAGRATIWGQGQYRQIVQDQFGNVQWDQVVGQVPQNIDQTVNGTFTVNGSTILNGGLQVNNSNEPGGPSDIKGGLVIEAGSGQTVALEVLGAIASPPGTGGLIVNNGLIVNPDAGQVTALELGGDLQINGSDEGTTYETGQRIVVRGGNSPGFIAENTTDSTSYGMWDTAGNLVWGTSDNLVSGNIVTELLTLGNTGNLSVKNSLAVAGNLNVAGNATLAEALGVQDLTVGDSITVTNTTNTQFLVLGGQDVHVAGPSDGTTPLIIPAGAYLLWVPGLPALLAVEEKK